MSDLCVVSSRPVSVSRNGKVKARKRKRNDLSVLASAIPGFYPGGQKKLTKDATTDPFAKKKKRKPKAKKRKANAKRKAAPKKRRKRTTARKNAPKKRKRVSSKRKTAKKRAAPRKRNARTSNTIYRLVDKRGTILNNFATRAEAQAGLKRAQKRAKEIGAERGFKIRAVKSNKGRRR
jgi:hypothetical protein